MPNLQVRNVPQDLHERLRRQAREGNCSMRALVLAAIERELRRREWQERWAKRPEIDLGVSAAEAIRAERDLRDGGPRWTST